VSVGVPPQLTSCSTSSRVPIPTMAVPEKRLTARAGHAAALAYVIGRLLREVSAGLTFSGENLGGVDDRLRVLRDSGFPHVVEAAAHLASARREAEFEFGLALMIAALEGHPHQGSPAGQ